MDRRTILVVDDQAELVELLVITLKKEYTVKVAIHGSLALQIAEMGGVDLILLDVLMPEMSGYEVCRQLKANPATRDIPIIFLTGKQHIDDEAEGFALGAVDYIHKPPNPQLLRARIATQLELKRHRDHLERLVQERTRELERAKRQLESANQAKSDFLAVVSHEMRTPLNHVIGFADCLLSDSALREDHRSFAQFIRDSGVHLLSNIMDIIDFVRLDPATFTLEHSVFDLAATVQEVLAALRKEAEQKGLALQFELQPSTPAHVVGDHRRLGQVLRHLLGNGVKFTAKGSVLLRIAAEPLSVPGKVRLHFTILDTGCGIPEDKLSAIFQQFTQVEGPMTRKHDGFGLGLAICQKLVRLMSGTLRVVRSDSTGTEMALSVDLQLPSREKGAVLAHYSAVSSAGR
ncbi:MAG: response regulator [Magnetococcales bacterium]|nr:response regulator [Magnetococcales bacterium]